MLRSVKKPGDMRNPTALSRAVPLMLLFLGFAILAAGFFSTDIGSLLSRDRAVDILRISFYTAVLALIVRFLQAMHYANSLLLVWVALHIFIVGIGPVLATTILAAAAAGLGSLALPERIPGRLPLGVIGGLALFAGTLGWLLPFRMHYRVVYLLLAAIICWWRRRAISKIFSEQAALWKTKVAASPRVSAFAVLVLGLASTGTWLPTVQYDDLVYHMGIPAELAAHAYYRMDAASEMWAVAPWTGDVIQAMVHVIGGEDARSSVDLLWLALAVLLILELSRRLGGTEQTGWLAVASLGSLPLVVALLGGMQGELASLALSMGAALIVVSAGKKPDPRRLVLLSIFMGIGVGLKITNVFIMAPLALWLLARWRFKVLWRELLPVTVLGLFVAGSSFAYAELLTGNPVLPLFNGWFHSEYTAPENFSDPRWLTPVRPDLLWRLTFATDQYCECWGGAAGFQWLALIGVLPLALAWRRTRGVVICALAGVAMLLAEVRYARYMLPMLVLLLPAFAASLRAMVSARMTAFAFILLAGINVFYGTNASWILHGGVVKSMVYPSEGKDKVLRSFAPERLLADYVRTSHGPEVRVLLADPGRPYIGPFAGVGFTTAYYDREVNGMLLGGGSDAEAHSWLQVFDRLGITHVLVTDASQSTNLMQALQTAHAETEQQRGDATLYRLEYGFSPAVVDTGSEAFTAIWTTDRKREEPTVTDARVGIQCTKAEGGAFLTVNAYDETSKLLGRKQQGLSCPGSGEIRFAFTFFTAVAPSRVDFSAKIGALQNPAARMVKPEVRPRRDAMRIRDLSARVRAWTF